MHSEMFQFVKKYLEKNGGEETKIAFLPFRKRSDHIKRVYMWVERLIDEELHINKEAVLVSALFHDIGYSFSLDNLKHAENSAILCKKYLKENGYDTEFIKSVVYLVQNHSNKELMSVSDTPLELIVLMEADLLDETGALSIVMDCMMEGSQEIQTFEKTYEHILKYSCKILNSNPMVTEKGQMFWKRKQIAVQTFLKHLEFDLGLENIIL